MHHILGSFAEVRINRATGEVRAKVFFGNDRRNGSSFVHQGEQLNRGEIWII